MNEWVNELMNSASFPLEQLAEVSEYQQYKITLNYQLNWIGHTDINFWS